MAAKKPLVLDANGNITQLQAGDTIGATDIILNDINGTVAQQSGTTLIPYSNAAPLATAGTQIMSTVITPLAIGSVMEIDFSTIIDTSATNLVVILALFRGTTCIAVAASAASAYNGNIAASLSLKANDTTTSLSPITYSIRVGISTAGTWYLGRGSAATFGGTNPSAWTIREMM